MKNIHDDLSSLDLGIHEAGDLVHSRPLCRLMFAQCYALVAVHAVLLLDHGNIRRETQPGLFTADLFVDVLQARVKAADLVIDHAQRLLKSLLKLASNCHHLTDTFH